jgi:site-specific recombinase XerD
MTDKALLGPWLRRFLSEHLVSERNRSRNTQRSYRDTFCQLLQFIERVGDKRIDRLLVEDVTADRIRVFLTSLEEERGCSSSTRNQRLAAIHSLAHFIGLHSPEHLQWCGELRTILAKKTQRPLVTYLEKAEMDDLLAVPNRAAVQGQRDYIVLLFLYNTGARADEVANVKIANLNLAHVPERGMSSVLIHGKGSKQRRCPLWPKTVTGLLTLVGNRSPTEHVFLNRRQQPLTRFGIYSLVRRYAKRLEITRPSLAEKHISPHVIRHTTAMHLLRAGVDINTIRAWLGHVCLTTTNVYAEADLEMKAKALALCEVKDSDPPQSRWSEDKDLMEFLRSL